MKYDVYGQKKEKLLHKKIFIEAATITDDPHLMRQNQNHSSNHAKLFRTSSINK